MKRIIAVWLVIMVLIGGMIGVVNLSTHAEVGNEDTGVRYASQSKSILTIHNPISIYGNDEFATQAASEGWEGDGTDGNPYMIENYDINASSTHGITIGSTDVYFIIKSCAIHDGGGTYYGLCFDQVTNCIINNVILYNNYYGIRTWYFSNNTITNSTIYNNSYGLILWDSSDNNTISYCSIFKSTQGIELLTSVSNLITHCAIYNNSYYGVSLLHSTNNIITKCNVYKNSMYGGISFEDNSSNNHVTDCNITENTNGVYIYNHPDYPTNYNIFHHNNFINNSQNACDLHTNYWNDTSGKGNYWSDYTGEDADDDDIGDIPYSIPGGINQDNYPLMLPWPWPVRNINKDTYYTTIQKAIDVADVSDTIEVSNGTYYENVVINKTLTLIGEDRETTIIDGNGTGDVVYITADWVNVSEFSITNTNGASGLRIEGPVDNGYQHCSQNNTITNCAIYNNFGNGLGIAFSVNNTISSCAVYNSIYGIIMGFTSFNTITNCAIYNNSRGIDLDGPTNYIAVHYCNIYSNSEWGVTNKWNGTEYTANAAYCWWGSLDGPSAFGPGSGDAVSSNVLYEPWLTRLLDFLPPTVESTQPVNGAVDMAVDAEIVITFSEPMNISTTPGNITIVPEIQIQEYVWSNENKTLTLILASNLSSFTQYTIIINANISDGITDSNGMVHSIENMQEPYQFSFRTKDTTPPEITNVQATLSAQEIHSCVNITAFISDNAMVNKVYVNITYPNGTLFGNFSMTGIGLDANRNGTYYYNAAYSVLGIYIYYIWANDTNGNANKSVVNQFTIQDITKPEISNVEANPLVQVQNGWINISCTVTDNVEVNIVKVNVTGPTGFALINDTMKQITGTNNYYYNATYFIPGTYYFLIWVNDTSGNENSSLQYSFVIFIPSIIEPTTETNITAYYTGYGNLSVSIVATPPSVPSNLSSINIFIEITAPPTMNINWIYIEVPYNESSLPADVQEASLRLYYWTGLEWKKCDITSVDTVNNIVWANVTHLTIFAPMAEKVVVAPSLSYILLLYVTIAIVILALIIGISLKIVSRRKPKEELKPEPLPPKKIVERHYPEVITCDYCNQAIVVPKERPPVVRCHICGKKITLK